MAAIEVRGLRKSYRGVVALDGLDLTVPEGGVFGFLGPNGAGKTTTIRALVGHLRASGSISLLGVEVPRSLGSVVDRVGAIKNPRIREQIQWHDPANASCKYKRAMDAQGTRTQTKELTSLADLAASEKPLIEVVKLDPLPRPCFGFGTPGTL